MQRPSQTPTTVPAVDHRMTCSTLVTGTAPAATGSGLPGDTGALLAKPYFSM
jgi:hypothetical protein